MSENWIPVEEKLPFAEYGESDSVLATCQFEDPIDPYAEGFIHILYFDGGCWCWPTGEVYENKVIAWMPLPKPYRRSKVKE